MNHYEIITKLIGPITATGDSSLDDKRFSNLCRTKELVEELLSDINLAARSKNNYQASMKKIGESADNFLKFIGEEYSEEVK